MKIFLEEAVYTDKDWQRRVFIVFDSDSPFRNERERKREVRTNHTNILSKKRGSAHSRIINLCFNKVNLNFLPCPSKILLIHSIHGTKVTLWYGFAMFSIIFLLKDCNISYFLKLTNGWGILTCGRCLALRTSINFR